MNPLIHSIEVEEFPLTLKESYTIAYQTVSEVQNILFKINLNDGFTACGIAAPEEEVTNETIASTGKILRDELVPKLLRKKDLKSVVDGFPALSEEYAEVPAALASIDFALIQASAHCQGQTVQKFLGAKKKSLPTTITINIHTPADTLSRAKTWLTEGYTMLKIKGGLSIESDLEKLFLLRKHLKPSVSILFDANQGYAADEARYFLKTAKKLDLIAIEQPVKKDAKELLLSLAGEKSIPIMADESACSVADVEYLAKNGVQFFNIKMMKCGGIRNAFILGLSVVKHDRKMIFSCMDECALSNAYSLSAALCIPQIGFVDLDSFTDYADDPTAAWIAVDKGNLSTTL